MNRKYLDDIKVNYPETYCDDNDTRQERWAQEREEYGFDERDTWSLENTFYCWLYEHLKMYVERASEIIDLDFHKFEYEGEELTQMQCIDRMIYGCEIYFQQDDDWNISEENQNAIDDVAKIWSIVLPAMWW